MKQKIRKTAEESTLRAQGAAGPTQAPPPEPPLPDEEGWLALIEPVFEGKPEKAETFAWRLSDLKRAIESGPEGVKLAVESLDEGIRTAYRYTQVYQAAFRLFCLYLAGKVVGALPQELLEDAIECVYERGKGRGR